MNAFLVRLSVMSGNKQNKSARVSRDSARFKTLREQIEKNSAFFSVRSLLFTTLLLVVSGFALISWMQTQLGERADAVTAIIKMGNACLVFVAVYFVIVEYLFRKRPEGLRLFQRFIWYVSILVIVALTGLITFLVS